MCYWCKHKAKKGLQIAERDRCKRCVLTLALHLRRDLLYTESRIIELNLANVVPVILVDCVLLEAHSTDYPGSVTNPSIEIISYAERLLNNLG